MRVIHHENGDSVVDAQISRAEKLAVAFEVREADQIRSQHLDESNWASAILYVRPAGLAYSRHVEAVAGRNEANFSRGEWIDVGRVSDNLVFSEVFVLRTLHRRGEDQLHVFLGHCDPYFSGSDLQWPNR